MKLLKHPPPLPTHSPQKMKWALGQYSRLRRRNTKRISVVCVTIRLSNGTDGCEEFSSLSACVSFVCTQSSICFHTRWLVCQHNFLSFVVTTLWYVGEKRKVGEWKHKSVLDSSFWMSTKKKRPFSRIYWNWKCYKNRRSSSVPSVLLLLLCVYWF